MNRNTLAAMILVAGCALSTGTLAQSVYKCAGGYSQTPCTDGTPLATADNRTPAQKAAADAAIKRDAKVADAMEKDRLRQDAAATRYVAPVQAKAPEATASAPVQVLKKKKKKNEPEYFTAQVPGEHKKKGKKEPSPDAKIAPNKSPKKS